MRSWIRIVLGILLIAVLGGLFWQATRQREPVYKGRRLSVWMKDWRNGYDPALQSAAREAVRAMGTNTIPYVRAELRRHDSPFKQKLINLARKQTRINFHLRTAEEVHEEAAIICAFAGPSVRGQLIGDWIQLLERGGTNELWNAETAQAGGIEGGFGPEAFAPLMNALYSTNVLARSFAVGYLRYVPSRAKAIVPSLLGKLTDTNCLVRGTAALSLGAMGREPKTVVPALLRGLDDPNELIRAYCIRGLAAFTNEAPSIVPSLLRALGDTNHYVRGAAKLALKQIDTEAASRAGAK